MIDICGLGACFQKIYILKIISNETVFCLLNTFTYVIEVFFLNDCCIRLLEFLSFLTSIVK